MKRKIIICITALLLILLIAHYKVAHAKTRSEIAQEKAKIAFQHKIDGMSVPELIDHIAPQFGQDPKLIRKITHCESGWVKKNHDNNRAFNVTGIHDKTWYGWLPLYEKAMGETLDINSTYDQLKMMSFVFSLGEEYRDDWTTYVAYTNGGVYTFYSNLLKGWYTVICK